MPENDPTERALMEQALTSVPATSEGRQTQEQIFLSELARRIAEWFDANENNFKDYPPPPRLFLLSKDSPHYDTLHWPHETKSRSLRAPDCLEEGDVFVCDIKCKSSYVASASLATSGDAVAFIEANQLEDRTFAILLASQQRVLVHFPGDDLQSLIQYKIEPYKHGAISLGEISEALDYMHAHGTSTHLGLCKVWVDAKKKIMVTDAEATIQGFVLNGLRMRFRSRSCFVDHEVTCYKGRQDIRVHWISRESQACDIGLVIELKVLRPKYSESKNIAWLKKGIEQVNNYGETDVRLKDKWVACYDAREDPSSYPECIDELASNYNVIIRRYVMVTTGH